jgi:hypothetical protein
VGLQQTFLYRIAKGEGRPEAAGAGIEWELLSPAQVGKLTEIGPFDPADGLERLRRGDRCYTVSIGGRLVHYSWVQRSGVHPITEAGIPVPVRDGEFWIYNCRTSDLARGKGIYPATLDRIVRDCFDQGCHTAWIYTSLENAASQKGILRAGFRQADTLRALRVGSRYFALGKLKASTSR